MGAAVNDGDMRGNEPSLLVCWEMVISVHQRESLRRIAFFDGMRLGLHQVFDERGGIGGGRKDVHIRVLALELCAALDPYHAAHQIEDHIWPLFFEGAQRGQPSMCSVLRALTHDAGIEHHDVCLFGYRRRAIAQPFELGRHSLRVGHVHLTAGSPNVIQHERHYTGPTLRHEAEDRLGRILTAALLVSLTAGCTQRTLLPVSESPRSPTSLPAVTATRGVATEQVPTAVPIDKCTEAAGSLQAGVYRGIAVAQDIPFNLYLPPCYDAQARHYPTLYLLHGYPYDEAHWESLGAIKIADDGIGAREWPP